MKEFRIHGRGGQGSVVTAELLAIAAFENGFESQAFPYLGGGGERRGAPVQAFARISNTEIRLKSHIENPHFILVQDITLLEKVDILRGVREKGTILLNTEKNPLSLKWNPPPDLQIYCFPATKIALEVLGKPIMNTSMLGALAVLCKEIHIQSLEKALQIKFPEKLANENIQAVKVAYGKAKKLFHG